MRNTLKSKHGVFTIYSTFQLTSTYTERICDILNKHFSVISEADLEEKLFESTHLGKLSITGNIIQITNG